MIFSFIVSLLISLLFCVIDGLIGLVEDCGGDEVDNEVKGANLLVPPVWNFSVAAGYRIGILCVVGLGSSFSNRLTISLLDTVTFSLESTIGGVCFAMGVGIYLFVSILRSIGGVLRLVSGVEIVLRLIANEVEV